MLNKLQRRVRRNVGPRRAACLETLVHRGNVASLNLFAGITMYKIRNIKSKHAL